MRFVDAFFRWLSGDDTPRPTTVLDDLEPYCDEDVLLRRMESPAPLPDGTHKAIHKIGARYGAEL
jgi:hypothetical protein